MVTGIISISLGIIFLIFGYLIYVKEKYDLINDFTEQKKKGLSAYAYARRVGFIELVTGIVINVYGVIGLITRIPASGIAGTVIICLCAIIALVINERKKI